jgi:prepilin-type N-terminal cleavage/methylation domain-containing protein
MVSPEIVRGHRTARRGFSLVEVLLVVLIMGILAGIVGSLMRGFVSGYEFADDQTVARRRAYDVFNILRTPVLSAGLGLPADNGAAGGSSPVNNGYYFGTVNGYAAPISEWSGPVQLIENSFTGKRDALRLVYSVRSGVKQVSSGDVAAFSEARSGAKLASLRVTSPLPGGYDGITVAGGGPAHSVHSYITFPGNGMRPLLVTGTAAGGVSVAGMTPRVETVISEDIVERGVIRPYHDIYFVRAGVAYVDDKSTFCFADVTDEDISAGALPRASELKGAAYRVEGVKAVRFDVEVSGGAVRSVTAFVVAEGDSGVTGKRGSAGAASQEFRTRYAGVDFDPGVYYEEFEMRWRTRNVESPEV